MNTIQIYKYDGVNGGCIVSPLLLPMEHTDMVRLVAAEGMSLYNGELYASVIDILSSEINNWQEVQTPIETEGEIDGEEET